MTNTPNKLEWVDAEVCAANVVRYVIATGADLMLIEGFRQRRVLPYGLGLTEGRTLFVWGWDYEDEAVSDWALITYERVCLAAPCKVRPDAHRTALEVARAHADYGRYVRKWDRMEKAGEAPPEQPYAILEYRKADFDSQGKRINFEDMPAQAKVEPEPAVRKASAPLFVGDYGED